MIETASGGPLRRRVLSVCAGASLALAGLYALAPPHAAAEVLLNETFAGASTNPGDWIAPTAKGDHTPCLTAAGVEPPEGSLSWCKAVREGKAKPDAAGAGAFELTDNSNNSAAGLLYDRELNARRGLRIQFEQFQYNTTTGKSSGKGGGADGISFFLIDGAVSKPGLGDSGGWLGYRNLKGAFVGVGFDQFGNFSNPKHWGSKEKGDKGPGQKPNSVAIRGSEGSGYQYVTGVSLPEATQALALDDVTDREKARRTVTITISTKGVMALLIDFHEKDGKGPVEVLKGIDLGQLPGQGPLPEKVKLGFAASTGANTNYHAIRNVVVSALDPDLTTTVSAPAPFKAGGTGTYEIAVANKQAAGPTGGPTTATFDVPAGQQVKSAEGTDWTCKTEGQRVRCETLETLEPGQGLPPIKVRVGLPADAGDGTATAAVATDNEQTPADNTASAKIEIEKPVVGPVPEEKPAGAKEKPVGAEVKPAGKAGFCPNAFQSRDRPTALSTVNAETGDLTEIRAARQGDNFNAIGFNAKDHKLYGWDDSADKLVIIDPATGEMTRTDVKPNGTGEFPAAIKYQAGDVSPDGKHLYLMDGSSSSPTMSIVNVDPDAGDYLSFEGRLKLTGAGWTGAADIAFHPADGQIYTVGSGGGLWRVDPNTGKVESLGNGRFPGSVKVPVAFFFSGGGAYGGLFFDGAGNLYASDNAGPLRKLDLTGSKADAPIKASEIGKATKVADQPRVEVNDGASCIGR